MDTVKNIVVANDSLTSPGLHPDEPKPMQIALEKAALVEHYTGANLIVADILYDHIVDETSAAIDIEEQNKLVDALKARAERELQELTRPNTERVASLEARVLWSKNRSEAILDLVDEYNADLLIKPVARHKLMVDYIHAPLDWALMRQADCPVLISKNLWPSSKCVLACLDAGNESHDHINVRILRTGQRLAMALGAEFHIASVYADIGRGVEDYQYSIDFEGLKNDMKKRREASIARLLRELEIDGTPQVIPGNPAKAISALVQELRATVAVVGTAARGGLAKFFVGNTSEDLISEVQCDVVSVRDLED